MEQTKSQENFSHLFKLYEQMVADQTKYNDSKREFRRHARTIQRNLKESDMSKIVDSGFQAIISDSSSKIEGENGEILYTRHYMVSFDEESWEVIEVKPVFTINL